MKVSNKKLIIKSLSRTVKLQNCRCLQEINQFNSIVYYTGLHVRVAVVIILIKQKGLLMKERQTMRNPTRTWTTKMRLMKIYELALIIVTYWTCSVLEIMMLAVTNLTLTRLEVTLIFLTRQIEDDKSTGSSNLRCFSYFYGQLLTYYCSFILRIIECQFAQDKESCFFTFFYLSLHYFILK